MRIPPFGVERWFVRYEFKVSTNIAESCIQPFTVKELCDLCRVDYGELIGLRVGYSDGLGSEDLRQAIAGLYPGTGPDNVLVTTGAIEANFLVAQALLEPGHRAVAVFPAYQQLYSVPASTGAAVTRWELREEQGYLPDLGQLERIAPPQAPLRMLTVNFPHNPSGVTVGRTEMQDLVEFAAKRGAYLHSDEVYRGLTLRDGSEPSPSARDLSPEAIAVGSMSKAYGLPGARIGWIAGPSEVVQRCAEIRDYVSICPSALGERLALMALRNREAVLSRNRAIARRNFTIFREFLERNQDVLSCPLPGEGVVAFPRYCLEGQGEPGGRDPARHAAKPPGSVEFCARLAEEHGVLLIPGQCFEGEHHFRIGFGYETETLVRGLGVLQRYLDAVLRP
jgi:aspartate/methionine/tyrosine aminotransferase